MAVTIDQISPVAHWPLVLGVVRTLNVAALIDTFCPPHPAHVLACGRGVEAMLLAILDGHHALSKVGARLEDRGMFPMLQPGLKRASLHAYRLGQILDALCAANLNSVLSAMALKALEVYTITAPGKEAVRAIAYLDDTDAVLVKELTGLFKYLGADLKGMVEAVILGGGSHERIVALAQQNRMPCNGHAGHPGVAEAALICESQYVLIELLRLFEIIYGDRPVRHIIEF